MRRQSRHPAALRLGAWIGGLSLVATLAIVADRGVGASLAGCDIKGNISLKTGERIYHVPGQTYYDETRIDRRQGERWFCSEEAARAAGWRKAKL
jgi:hypothetical protein